MVGGIEIELALCCDIRNGMWDGNRAGSLHGDRDGMQNHNIDNM